MAIKIAIIAGEPSGDMLAANLITHLKKQSSTPVEFIGVGGSCMANAGFVSSYNMDILSVGGYGLDVLLAVPKIYCLFRKITKQIIEFNPDVFIGVDAPDFNFHVEKKLKQHGIKTIHYISPTIWAWRYERIFKIKKTTDFMLCIFPMEPAIYAKENIPAKFIGNPLANEIEIDINTQKYRDKLGLSEPYTTVFTVLVGSRKAELKRLAGVFIEACRIIHMKIPNAMFLFPFAKQSTHDAFYSILANSYPKFKFKILFNQTRDAIKAADLVLCKSGTVSLEVALCKKPMVISYIVSKFTEWIVRRKISIKYVGQPNIFLNEGVVKELLQDDATAENLANEMLNLYYDKKRQEYIVNRFYDLHRMLKQDNSNEAAIAILNFMHSNI
ncbi:MAG: lipid-A-disaccharide synthase [Burkholderiales bacterium]|nr:lipid-A-disaccharide synthase [Burkholderiales bacterium]